MSSLVQVIKLLSPKHLESRVSPLAVHGVHLAPVKSHSCLGVLSSLTPPPLLQCSCPDWVWAVGAGVVVVLRAAPPPPGGSPLPRPSARPLPPPSQPRLFSPAVR